MNVQVEVLDYWIFFRNTFARSKPLSKTMKFLVGEKRWILVLRSVFSELSEVHFPKHLENI